MKRHIMIIFLGILLFFPVVCSADYVIRLKDGRSFSTHEYQEEGDQIKFRRYGGFIGLPKDQVVNIEKVSDVPEKAILKPPEQVPVPEKGKETAGAPVAPSDAAKTEDEKTADPKKENPQLALMKEKRRLVAERKSVSEAFNQAKLEKDKSARDRCWNELLKLQNQLDQLQKKVLAENGGMLPEWWGQTD